MDRLPIVLLLLANAIFSSLFFYKVKKSQQQSEQDKVTTEKTSRELKRRVLELQVLQSLGERVGYSLDLRKILEVITDSLNGLVDYSTISYMMFGSEGRVILRTHVKEPVSRLFLDQVKGQMGGALSIMVNHSLQPSLIDETISGVNLDERVSHPIGSFFHLPIVIGGQVVALINVSSLEKGLYGDEDTAILYTIINQVSMQATKLAQVLENEKRRLSAMISSLGDGIIMVDPNFNLIVANPAVYSLLNLPLRSSLLDIFESLIKNCDLKNMIIQSLSSQQISKMLPFELNDKAIRIEVNPVKDRYDYLLGAVVSLIDETAQKQLERLREDFTAMMVHELRTPLTTISYGIETIVGDFSSLKPEELNHYLTVIKQATSDVLALVNDLLDVARIEAGKLEVIKQPNNLVNLISEKINLLKPLADQKHISLTSVVDPNLNSVMLDRIRIGQALTNLISNSIKYTDNGGVKVQAISHDNKVWVAVSDTGDGISSEDLPKLFSKFRQIGRGKTGEKGGTGLGLVIVKGIIEAHGGTIWADSEGRGKGSIFTFTIPLS